MTLVSPDKSDFSVVFVNNTQNAKTFYLSTEDMAEAAAKDLNLWVTETDSYLQNKGTVERTGNGWQLTIPAYSIATATTLATEPERTPEETFHLSGAMERRRTLHCHRRFPLDGLHCLCGYSYSKRRFFHLGKADCSFPIRHELG